MGQILTKIKRVSKVLESSSYSETATDNEFETLLLETDKAVLPTLKQMIREYSDKSIWEQLEYSLINKVHFDRAFFVRLGCEAVGGDYKSILQAMASVELRYASGTAIDDVFDFNDERMGKRSLPSKYGNNLAISFGAILKSLASIALLSCYKTVNVDLESFIKINIKEETTHYQVYLGQVADILSEKISISDISDNFYLEMIKNATGVDAGYCFELGCLLGGGTQEQQANIYDFGVALGTAMQLRDDMIDYINDRNLINKAPFRDFETNKKRLPIILAYRFGTESERETIRTLFKKKTLNDTDKEKLTSIVSNELVLSYLRDLNATLLDAAKRSLELVGAYSKPKEFILLILDQIVI